MKYWVSLVLMCSLTNPLYAASSITFGGATSHVANYGSGTSVDNLDPMTFIAWIYPTTFTNGRVIGRKAGAQQKFIRLEGTGGRLNATAARSVTGADFITTSSMTLNTWNLIVWQWDSSASVGGKTMHIYTATGTVAVAEMPYIGGGTNGSGTHDDASSDLTVGNNVAATQSFQGQIGPFAYMPKLLTVAEMEEWRRTTVLLSSGGVQVHQGFNGVSTQYDETGNGNNGTVTGAVASLNGPPYGFK